MGNYLFLNEKETDSNAQYYSARNSVRKYNNKMLFHRCVNVETSKRKLELKFFLFNFNKILKRGRFKIKFNTNRALFFFALQII